MGKLIEAIRKLGSKLTGKSTVESKSLVNVINDIANDYEIPEQTQADWNENDTTSSAYIKNKPTIPSDKHLYQHNLIITEHADEGGVGDIEDYLITTIINDDETPFTNSTIRTYLINICNGNFIMASGVSNSNTVISGLRLTDNTADIEILTGKDGSDFTTLDMACDFIKVVDNVIAL